MTKVYYFPSTFYGFVGRGYGKRRTKRYGKLVFVGRGGNVETIPLTQKIKQQFLNLKDRALAARAELTKLPVYLGEKLKQLIQMIRNRAKRRSDMEREYIQKYYYKLI